MSPLPHPFDQSPLFRDLKPHQLRIVESAVEELVYRRGDLVVTEGERSDAMYVLVEGQARVIRGDLTLSTIGPGEWFGELGFLTGEARSASVRAETELTLLRLAHSRVDALIDTHPHLVAQLLKNLAYNFRQQLTDVTDTVSRLLSSRSRPQRMEVTVRIDGAERVVKAGTPLVQLLPERVGGHRVVAALLDRRAVSLSTPLFASARLDPLTPAVWEGQRIYRTSVGLLMVAAASVLDPNIRLRVGPSLGFAHVVEVEDWGGRPCPQLAAELLDVMQRLAGQGTVFRQERWTVEEARAQFALQGWTDAERHLRTWREETVPLVSCAGICAFAHIPLVPAADYLETFELVADDGDLLLYFGDYERRSSDLVRALHPSRLAQEHASWLSSLGADSVGAYNELCIQGRTPEIIRVSEGFHEKRISQIADAIAAENDAVRIICVAGPTSAGKTTFIRRLSVQLLVNGVKPYPIGLDDFYVDREQTVRDEHGERDFEAFEALDLPLMADQLERLLSGERVKTAHYDFKLGRSFPEGGAEIQLGEGDVLLLEGIHALNPRVPIEQEQGTFRLFINPMTSLPLDHVHRVSVSDIRLLRRIVRDRRRRNISAADNITRWPSVRRGERRHIFKHQSRAHAVFNTSLIYEPSVLKVYAERYLLEVPRDHEAYTTASRLRALVDHYVAIYPDHVPPTSLLKEFIGGSGFDR